MGSLGHGILEARKRFFCREITVIQLSESRHRVFYVFETTQMIGVHMRARRIKNGEALAGLGDQ